MSRLTLRLPETLHRQLEKLARTEAVSMNQYIVFALTRQATLAYTVQHVTDEEIQRQQASFTSLLQRLGEASFQEINKTLSDRETVKPERGLSPTAVQALRKRISKQRTSG